MRWIRGRAAKRVRSSVLVAAITLAACGTERSPDGVQPSGSGAGRAPAVRDSAGVRIVESSETVAEELPLWTLSHEPELSIGVADGPKELQLHLVGGVALLADEAIAVANRGTSEVRIFERDGSFRSTIGRAGEGPGELRQPSDVRFVGDRLLVWDGSPDQNNGPPRLSIFKLSGELLGTARFDDVATSVNKPRLVQAYTDGTLLVSRSDNDYAAAGYNQTYMSQWLMDERGTVVKELPREPLQVMGLQELMRDGKPDGKSLQPRVFSPRTTIVGDAEGYWIGTGETYEIRHHRKDGTLDRIIRWSGPDLTVPQDSVRAFRERSRELFMAPESFEFSKTYPAYKSFFFDSVGRIWVQRYSVDSPVEPSDWLILSSQGSPIGRIVLPSDGRAPFVRQVGEDWVLGVMADALGVQRLVRYGLTR